jgi:hypothetical protein
LISGEYPSRESVESSIKEIIEEKKITEGEEETLKSI